MAEKPSTEADAIRAMLTDCENPVAAIKSFQSSHSFGSPVINSALPLLDLLGTPRYEFHSQVLVKYAECLLGKLDQLNHEQKLKMVSQLLSGSHLDPVKLLLKKLLSSLKPIPDDVLAAIAQHPNAYECCPVQVKRVIWETNSSSFGTEVSTLFDGYVEEKNGLLVSVDADVPFLELTPRKRREHEITKKLVEMVGSSQKLYSTMCEFLRDLFSQSSVPHYCTLRIDVLMGLHEAQSSLVRQDPYHKFIWCLDACVRERRIDDKRVKELSSMLQQQEDKVGDMAMAAHEPGVLHLVCTCTVGLLADLAKQCKLPRDSSTLKVLLRLLSRGLAATDMFREDIFCEPQMDTDVIHRHMSTLVSFCTDVDGVALHTTLQAETRHSGTDFLDELSKPLPDSFVVVLSRNPLVLVLALHLTAKTARRGCSKSLQRMLQALSTAVVDNTISRYVPSTVWFHFCGEIARLPEMSLAEEVSDDHGAVVPLSVYIFEKLTVPLCHHQPACLGQWLRVLALWPASARNALTERFQDSWLESLQPSSAHSDAVWRLYSAAFTALGWPTFFPEESGVPPLDGD